jgi:urease accessory protein
MTELAPLPSVAAPASPHQRVRGRAEVAFETGSRGPRLSRLFQQGSAKAMLPRVHADRPEVVFLNTAGGLTGGDDLQLSLSLGAGLRAVATTQTAERAYASLGPPARMSVRMQAGAGAVLHWLPQETILFDRAALDRHTEIDLAGDADLVMCETLVLGRAAMGETLRALSCRDLRYVRRDGRPVLVDPFRLTTQGLARRAGPAMLGDAAALSMLARVAPRAEDGLAAVRAALDDLPPGVRAAASGWDGRLVVRVLAADTRALRGVVARVLGVMTGRALPRVWAA